MLSIVLFELNKFNNYLFDIIFLFGYILIEIYKIKRKR
ncbi:hypothetical protein CSBG_03514 [Clostridium sp. 7_2_43FAA]|nr:hypothetical protein CSBG_03514 [Clostridium sp. 7_2_43FAA]MBP1868518.1 hypothetical protein [Clostridium tertium]